MSQHDLVQKDTKIVTQAEFDLIDAKSPALASNNEDTGVVELGAITGQHYYNEGDECMYYGDNNQDLVRLAKYSDCEPVAITRAALVALRNAGTLDCCVRYRVTNNTSATGGDVIVYPVGKDLLSHEIDYIDAAISNEALPGEWDIDTGRIHKLKDVVREVAVQGEVEVDAFPWGNNSITETRIDNATFTYSGGTVRGLIAEQESRVSVTGGILLNTTVSNAARLNIAGGVIYHSEVRNGSTLTNTSGNVFHSVVDSLSTVVQNGGQFYYNNVSSGGNVNKTIGSMQYTEVTSGGRVIQTNGTLYRNEISSNSLIRLDGTGRAYYNEVSANSQLDLRVFTGNAYYNRLSASAIIYGNGSGGNLQHNVLDSQARIYATTSPVLSVYFNSLSSNGYLYVRGGTTGRFWYNRLSNRARYLADRATGLNYDNSLDNLSYIYATDSAGEFYHNNLSANSYVYADRMTGGRIYRSSFNRGYLNARDSLVRFYDSEVSSYAIVYLYNNTNNPLVQYSTFNSRHIFYGYNGFAGTVRYIRASSESRVYVDTLTGTGIVERSSFDAGAFIRYSYAAGISQRGVHARVNFTYAAATANQVIGY